MLRVRRGLLEFEEQEGTEDTEKEDHRVTGNTEFHGEEMVF